jgi:hypothetical protein
MFAVLFKRFFIEKGSRFPRFIAFPQGGIELSVLTAIGLTRDKAAAILSAG